MKQITFYITVFCLSYVTRLQAQQYHSMSEGNPEWIYYLQPRKDIATDASCTSLTNNLAS